VTGNVKNSLMAAGRSINISGPVGNSVRVAGSDVNIQNKIGADLIVAGSSVNIGQNSQISDDLAAVGATINMSGAVGGNAYLVGGQINIDGPVNGNVIIKRAGNVTLGSNAVIKGNLIYEASQPASISQGAVVGGQTEFTQTAKPKANLAKLASVITAFSFLLLFGSFFVLWFIAATLPKLVLGYVENSLHNVWQNLGIGLIAMVVTPVAAIILLATIIGIPFGLLLIGIYIVVMGLAKLIVPIFVGGYLFKWLGREKKVRVDWLAILVGVVATAVVGFIPFLGAFALFVVFLLALSQITLGIMGFMKANR